MDEVKCPGVLYRPQSVQHSKAGQPGYHDIAKNVTPVVEDGFTCVVGHPVEEGAGYGVATEEYTKTYQVLLSVCMCVCGGRERGDWNT